MRSQSPAAGGGLSGAVGQGWQEETPRKACQGVPNLGNQLEASQAAYGMLPCS